MLRVNQPEFFHQALTGSRIFGCRLYITLPSGFEESADQTAQEIQTIFSSFISSFFPSFFFYGCDEFIFIKFSHAHVPHLLAMLSQEVPQDICFNTGSHFPRFSAQVSRAQS